MTFPMKWEGEWNAQCVAPKKTAAVTYNEVTATEQWMNHYPHFL